MLIPFALLTAFFVHKAVNDKSYKGDTDVGGSAPRRRSTMLSHTRG